MNYLTVTATVVLVLAISFVQPGYSTGSNSDSGEDSSDSSSSEEDGIPGFCRVAIVCENAQSVTISCTKKDRVLRIMEANYGRTAPDSQVCPYGRNHKDETDCYSDTSMGQVSGVCNGLPFCSLSANNNLFGDPCRGTYKYLRVVYCCKKSKRH